MARFSPSIEQQKQVYNFEANDVALLKRYWKPNQFSARNSFVAKIS